MESPVKFNSKKEKLDLDFPKGSKFGRSDKLGEKEEGRIASPHMRPFLNLESRGRTKS